MPSSPDTEESRLLERVKKGEPGAFESLITTYQESVFNSIYHILQNVPDIDDIAQEVFIRIYRSIGSFRGDSALSTWIYRITVNCCKDRIAHMQKERTESLVIMSEEGEKPREIPDHTADPQKVYSEKEFAAYLKSAIRSLPENYRIALTLREFEDLPYEEIGKVLNTTPNASKNLVYRAKMKLKELLDTFFKTA
ncbi:MAG: sigma-70 family RNA polymerase sigma factor [Candidatus Eremiobacteraeota bacterium]|nr:sigma-70 family RNA polymerase sigma factor [Candidatus Eremiobacteraeota bacterium]